MRLTDVFSLMRDKIWFGISDLYAICDEPISSVFIKKQLYLVELRPVGWSIASAEYVGCFHLRLDKWGLVPFSHCKCCAVAQTGDIVVSQCHIQWALQGARDRTVLDEKINGRGLVHC